MRYRIGLLTTFLLLSLTLVLRTDTITAQSSSGGGPGLFVASPLRETLTGREEVVRTRMVSVVFDRLELAAGARVDLNLFEDVLISAESTKITHNPSGSITWEGKINGQPLSSVLLIVNDDLMMGSINTAQQTWGIEAASDGLHRIVEINTAALIDHSSPPPEIGDAPGTRTPAGLATFSDDGTTYDILVAYTAAARAGAGGTDAIVTTAELAVAATNSAFASSGVKPRFHLVHTVEVAMTDPDSSSTMLNALENPADGIIDNIHVLRDEYHADFVVLLVDNFSPSSCGRASLQTTLPSIYFQDDAFGVVDRSCAIGNHSFAHELGHNLGLRHDWYVDDSTTPGAHAHGHVRRAAGWRTIMSYNTLCEHHAIGGNSSCTRLGFFSNPAVQYSGSAMGIPTSGPANCVEGSVAIDPTTCQADNRTVLNTGNVGNSQFRDSRITWTGAVSTDWNNAANWTMLRGSRFDVVTVTQVPRSIDNIYIPSATTTGRFPVIAGTAVARDVMIESGASITMNGGTLTVSGNWTEIDSAALNASGGKIVFASPTSQTISLSGASQFHDVDLGNGSTQTIWVTDADSRGAPGAFKLTGNLTVATGATIESSATGFDVDGNVTIKGGADFQGGTRFIKVGGDWAVEQGAFSAETSTVRFDGNNQTISHSGTEIVFNADFSDATPPSFPNGWAVDTISPSRSWSVSNSTALPNSPTSGNHARYTYSVNDAADTWFFTPAIAVTAGQTYLLSFNYGARQYNYPENLEAWIATGQTASSATTRLADFDQIINESWISSGQVSYTPASSGDIYLAFHANSAKDQYELAVDDIVLQRQGAGLGTLDFYNLEIAGSVTVQNNVIVANNMTTYSSGSLDVGANLLNVENNLANNGTVKQTKPVSGATDFLTMPDGSGGFIYRGLTITGAGNVPTTVSISNNGKGCNTPWTAIDRCFEITPNGALNATVRFWYLNSEKGSLNPDNVTAWHYNGSTWDALTLNTPARGSSGDYEWIEAINVNSFSPFAIGDSSVTPTAIMLSQDAVTTPSLALVALLLSAITVATSIIYRRQN